MSIGELPARLQGANAGKRVVSKEHGPRRRLGIFPGLALHAGEERLGPRLQAYDRAGALHRAPVAPVDNDASSGGHDLHVTLARRRQTLALQPPEVHLAISGEDLLDCQSGGALDVVVQVDERPAEQTRGDAAHGGLAGAGKTRHEYVSVKGHNYSL